MAESKGPPEIDINLLENRRQQYSRITPQDLENKLLSVLIQVKEPRKYRKKNVGLPGVGEPIRVKIPEEQLKAEPRVIKKEFSDADRKTLDDAEREIMQLVIRERVRGAVERLGQQNQNLVPYNEMTLDFAVQEFDELEAVIDQVMGGNKTERSEGVKAELRGMKRLVRGEGRLLKAAGAPLDAFFDGWAALKGTVRSKPRHDFLAREAWDLYSSAERLPDWVLGKEWQEKQDSAYSIMRGIAAIHRSPKRNIGQTLEGDYHFKDKHADFVEKAFGRNPFDEEGRPTTDIQAISFLGNKRPAKAELGVHFAGADNKSDVLAVVVGKNRLVTKSLLKKWTKNIRRLRGKTLWVNGVQWPIDRNTIAELGWKVGSGDRVFVGKKDFVNRQNYNNILRSARASDEIAFAQYTPRELESLFTMIQDPSSLLEVKRKIAVMMGTGIWDKLHRPGASVKQIYEQFEQDLVEYKKDHGDLSLDLIDENLIELTRIALLGFMEGGDLGWGFEYQDKEAGEGDNKTKVTKRTVAGGSTKATTDVGTPQHWLWSEASNGWKYWSHGTLQMDERTRRQILEHEPGWAPWTDKAGWIFSNKYPEWQVRMLGIDFKLNVPTTFDIAWLAAVKYANPDKSDLVRVFEDGEYKLKNMSYMDRIKSGVKMSDLKWREGDDHSYYRSLITYSQLAFASAMLSNLPDKETAEQFFGKEMATTSLREVLELIKRFTLGFRDMDKSYVERFLPFTTASFFAFGANLLPESPDPGYWGPKDVEADASIVADYLGDLAPKSNREFAKNVASNFQKYTKQYIKIGLKVSSRIARRELSRNKFFR